MSREYANRTTRSRIIPPTKAELALAATRGLDSITGEQLAQMRREGMAANRTPINPSSAPTATYTLEQFRAKIKQQAKTITDLKNKIAYLQLAVMTSK